MDFLTRFLSYINAAGAVHALIQAAVLLFTRRGNSRAHRFMAFFLVALAIGMANGMMTLLNLYESWPGLGVFMGSVVLTYGPLFYFYIRAMTDPHHGPASRDILHGIPFLLGLAAYAAYLKWFAESADLPGIIGSIVRTPWIVVTILAAIQTAGYVAGIVRLLRRHSERIKAAYATIERVNLGWLRLRLIIYAAIWAAALAMIIGVRFETRPVALTGQIVFFLIALNTFATGYRALLQSEIFLGPAESGPGRRYERSSLTPENAEIYKMRLLERMERERSYLDPEITLPKLAQALDIPVAHLSRVINELLGRNFYEFINRYRVEEAKRRLAGPDAGREKLIAVGLDCGFNSLATFNRVFKELTGRTPSDFRKNPAAL